MREPEHLEIGASAAIGGERDAASVGRPLGLQVAVAVVRQAAEVRAVHVHDVQIGDAALATAEGDALAVRRPCRPGDALEPQVAPRLALGLDVEQIQHVAAAALRGEGQLLSVGGKRALRVQEPQLLEIRIERALDQALDASAGFGVAEPEVDKDLAAGEAAVREERDVLAVVRQRRRQEDLAAAPAVGEQGLREFARPLELGNLGQVLDLEGFAPLVAEVLQRDAQLAPERALHADDRDGVHDLPDGFVAPALRDVGPECVAEPVREVTVGLLRHLLDGGNVPVQRRVAHPRVRERCARPERQILRHALGEPERRQVLREVLQAAARLAAGEDVVLEGVHHLVRQHVLEAAIIAGEVQQHAVAQRFSDAAGALSEIAGDVVLAEIRARREEHDRLLLAELVIEHARQTRVRPLCHARRVDRGLALLRVPVDQEVLGLGHVPVELVVLHLILAEIALRACRHRGHRRENDRGPRDAPATLHATLPANSIMLVSSRGLRGDRYHLGIVPESLQLVEAPERRVEQMNDEIDVVE